VSDLFAPLGAAVISRKGALRLEQGHVWVYRSDVVSLPASMAGVVEVVGERGRPYGMALASPDSMITLRLVTRGKTAVTADLVRERLVQAFARRTQLYGGGDAFRWVHGEGDLLPSIFVDRFGDALTLQMLSAAADAWQAFLVECLVEVARPRAVVVRNDATARRREGLATDIQVAHGAAPVLARYHEGDLALEVDLLADQKTGGFLDQATNHVRAAEFARGAEALDCFTYHGGFALQLARVATHVTAVDSSAAALVRARANAERAGLGNLAFEQADVFELLPELLRTGRRFDVVVLDPPAFASNKASEDRARRAYKEINLRGLKLLVPGGLLVTCSCSGRITPAAFDEIIAEAARDAQRDVQILERRGAGPDHPVLVGVPETDYLKCRIVRAL